MPEQSKDIEKNPECTHLNCIKAQRSTPGHAGRLCRSDHDNDDLHRGGIWYERTYVSISCLSALEPDNDDDADVDVMVLPHTRNKVRVKNSQP